MVKPVLAHGDRPLYALQPRQLDVWRLTPLFRKPPGTPQPKFIGYGGAAGGGKSHLARAVAAGVALRWPGSVSLLVRRTQPELYRNHVAKLQEEVPESLAVYRTRPVSELRWANGSRTVLGYLRSFADVTRYQGDEYDCMIFEESTHYAWETVNWLLSNRLRASGAPGSVPFALFPSNPGDIGHFWYKRWFIDRKYRADLEEDPEDFAFVQAFLHHNEILRRRDPTYERKLKKQPEPYRSWYLFGDWEKGAGVALPQLDRKIHLVPRFEPPAHWLWFGAFDWGFAHPWVFGLYTVSEDGRVFKVDTLRGRRQADGDLIRSIQEVCREREYPLDQLLYVAADRGIFSKRGRDVAYDGPTLAERMIQAGIPVVEANNERIAGLRQLREFLQWRDVHGEGLDDDPMLLFMDTEANQACIDTLERMVTDPLRPEDVLKVNADEFGEGGDDDYDETRYAVASRPARSRSVAPDQEIRAWDPEVLKAETKALRRVRDTPMQGGYDAEVRRLLGGH
jgi:phage terminase large subunit